MFEKCLAPLRPLKGKFAEILPKFCGKFANIWKIRCIESGKGAEILQKVEELLRKFAHIFLQWPLPEGPHNWIDDRFWKWLIVLRDGHWLEVSIIFRLCSSCRTNYWHQSESVKSSKKVLNYWTHPFQNFSGVLIRNARLTPAYVCSYFCLLPKGPCRTKNTTP